ncbi:MAG: SIR2 family protein, partial [Nitrosopumilus sp.]
INENCIVFRTEDYATFYPSQSGSSKGNDNLEQFLRRLYEDYTIVFVGVSFNDEYLLNALNQFYNRVKQNDEVGREKKVSYKSILDSINHYALLQEDMGLMANRNERGKNGSISDQQVEVKRKRKSKRERLEECKINIVTYKDHVDWTDWFADIRKLARKHKTSHQNVSIFEDPNS